MTTIQSSDRPTDIQIVNAGQVWPPRLTAISPKNKPMSEYHCE